MAERMDQKHFLAAIQQRPAKVSKAKGRHKQRKPGEMTRVEVRMQGELELLLKAGQVLWFRYEPVRLKLANNTHYTPDFMVMRANGEIEFIEVKGSWKSPNQEDARVKVKVAAEQYPMFHFVAYEKGKRCQAWNIERFNE